MDDQNYSCALGDKWFWESEVRWSLWIYWKDDFWTMKWGLGGKKIMYIDSKGEMDVVTLWRAKCGVTLGWQDPGELSKTLCFPSPSVLSNLFPMISKGVL